jgi:hypothetical protein
VFVYLLLCETNTDSPATTDMIDPHDHGKNQHLHSHRPRQYRERIEQSESEQAKENILSRSVAGQMAAQLVDNIEARPAETQQEHDLPPQCQAEILGGVSSSGTSDEGSVFSEPGEKSLRPRKQDDDDPTKYGRRPRRKTKPEKYDFKGNKETKEPILPARPKKKRHTQRKERESR